MNWAFTDFLKELSIDYFPGLFLLQSLIILEAFKKISYALMKPHMHIHTNWTCTQSVDNK